jgi:stage II sporulation protein D
MMTPPYPTVGRRRPARVLAAGLLALLALLALRALLLVMVGSAAAAPTGGGGVGLGPGAGAGAPPGTLVIRGGGDGHGVGMSQYGAEGEALHGASDRAILAHYYTGTGLGHVDPGRTVRVLVADGRATVRGASAAGRVPLIPARTYTVSAGGVAGGLVIAAAAGGHPVAVLRAPVTVTGPGPLRSGGGSYRGALQFSAEPSGGVRTVNVVGLDDYVRGVVAAEMPSSWAPAALEAQAIAARTYAVTTTVDGSGFDLYDDTRSQAYGGVAAETAPTDAAVAATAGQVVTDSGRPVVTYFFASSGGFTESIQNVWPGSAPAPWLVGVPDPYDAAAGDPYHSWHLQLSLAAATVKLGALVDGTLKRILVTRRGVSPRVISARVVGTAGTTTVSGAQLQQAFGLLSTDMSFTVG